MKSLDSDKPPFAIPGLPSGRTESSQPLPRFTITLEGSGTTTCTPAERVLVALERAQGFGRLRNLPRRLPVGCRRGGCGVCRARVLKGDYRRDPMSRAHISEIDEQTGLVLACSIYPLSDLLLRFETPVRGNNPGPQTTES